MDTIATVLPASAGGETSLRELSALMFRRWRIIVALIVVMVALMAGFMLLATPKYEIDAIVTQRTERDQLGSRTSLNNLGAALLANQPVLNETFLQFIQLLRSPSTVEALPDRDQIMTQIFADEWDAASKSWVMPSGLTFRIVRGVDQMFGLPPWKPPVAADFANFLEKQLKSEPVSLTSIYRISFDWKDPAFGIRLLSALIKTADDQIRTRTANELKERETYLSGELDKAQRLEERQALAQDLADTVLQEATLFANSNYSVQIVQPPTASAYPVSPRPILYLVFAALAGTVVGILVVLGIAVGRGFRD